MTIEIFIMEEEEPSSQSNSHRRPPNAYLLFCTEVREELLNNEPTLTHKTIMKRLGELWNGLTPEEKKPYQVKAQELQDEFRKVTPEYHYKQKKQKVKNPNQVTKVPGAICKLPIDPQYLMVLGAQFLLHNVNLLTNSQQPITSVAVLPPNQRKPLVMPPPPTVSNNQQPRVPLIGGEKSGVPSMPPPPGYNNNHEDSENPASISSQMKRITKRVVQTDGAQASDDARQKHIQIPSIDDIPSMPKPQHKLPSLPPPPSVPSMPPPLIPSKHPPVPSMPPPSITSKHTSPHHTTSIAPPSTVVNVTRIHTKLPSLPPPPQPKK